MPFPKKTEKILGGLAGMAVGYNDKKKCFIIRTGLGPKWGMGGYFEMPYKFIDSSYCQNFWILYLEDSEETGATDSDEENETEDSRLEKPPIIVQKKQISGFSVRKED